jgi:hypothetical protein
MKRALLITLLSVLWLAPADAQPPADPKLSAHLRTLVSGDPAQEAIARSVLLIKGGPQRPRPAVGAFVKFQGDADGLRGMFASLGASLHTVVGNLATAEIPIAELQNVAALPNVIMIEESR